MRGVGGGNFTKLINLLTVLYLYWIAPWIIYCYLTGWSSKLSETGMEVFFSPMVWLERNCDQPTASYRNRSLVGKIKGTTPYKSFYTMVTMPSNSFSTPVLGTVVTPYYTPWKHNNDDYFMYGTFVISKYFHTWLRIWIIRWFKT
jgi:hypothetical protein